MNALDERLEGPAKRAGCQAVLRFQDFGPPDPPVGSPCPRSRCWRPAARTRALFCRTQRVDGPTPLGDVGAGTERAGDLSVVMAEQPVAPLDEAFLAGPGDDGILDDEEISAEQLSTLRSSFPHPDRKAGLIQSRPSNSSAVHPRSEQPYRLTSSIRPSRSSLSRMTSAVSRYRCARSRSSRRASSASLRSVITARMAMLPVGARRRHSGTARSWCRANRTTRPSLCS